MKCCVLTERFPEESFIRWQADAVADFVVAGELVDPDFAIGAELIEIGAGNGFRGSRWQRGYRKLCERYLGRPGPKWCRSTETRWRQFLNDRRPDVVLAAFGTNAVRALAGCRATGTPLVAEFLGQDASMHLNHSSYRRALDDLWSYASRHVVLSTIMRDRLIDHGAPADKIEVIPIGVPIEQPPERSTPSSGSFEFLAVGRLVEKKAPLLTLQAFEQCRRSGADCVLTIIGDGRLMDSCRDFVETRQLTDCVKLEGGKSHEEVVAAFRRANCFVQHSIVSPDGDREGWPVAIAEAASHGLPVVATIHEGIPDEVIDGQTGYLVEEGDWQSMGDRMHQLVQDPSKAHAMGLAGYEHINRVGRLSTQIGKLRSVLEQVASQHG